MRLSFVLAVLLTATSAAARPYDEIMAEARDAFVAEDFTTAGELLDEAQTGRPYSLYLTRNRILTRLLTDRKAEAFAIAQEIADRGLVLETPPNEAFDAMRADPEFASIAAQMAENAKPKGEPQMVTEFQESGLLPEAISKDRKRMLIGSVRTGEIRNASANLSTFAKLDGGVFDIEQRKRAVYAAVNNQLAFEPKAEEQFAAVVKLDPKTGAVVERWPLGPAPALIGDIEVGKKGRIFASDSLTPRIFDMTPGAASRNIEDQRFANPQGIALDEKAGRLYVADYLTGLFVIDTKSLEVTQISNPTDAHLGGIDGLYLHKGDLIGVQNGTSPQRLVRIKLDKNGSTATSLEVLQQALPEWNEPTHGVVDGDNFVYVATSNWPAYDDEGNLREGAKLEPLRLMSAPLN